MKLTLTILLLLALFFTSSVATAQSAKGERADRATFNTLIAQLRHLHHDYAKVLSIGMDEARDSGEASASSQANLLAIQAKIDRRNSRLILISVRHGWDIPDFKKSTVSTTVSDGSKTETDRIFAPAQHAFKSRFRQEAVEIASLIRLPIISIKTLLD